MATKTITSNAASTPFAGGKPLYTKTETSYSTDSQGSIIPGSAKTTLLYQATPGGIFQAAATSTQGGKPGSWTFINKANTNEPIIGATAQKSLNTPGGALYLNTQAQIIKTATANGVAPTQMGQIASSKKNNTPTVPANPQTNPAGSSTPAQTINDFNSFNITGKDVRTSYDSSKLRYPKEMTDDQDRILFTAKQYGNRPINTSTVGFGERTYGSITGACIMGIQPTINDYSSVEWNGLEMSSLESALAQASATLAQGKDAGNRLQNTYAKEGGNVNTALQTYLAQEAAGTKGLLSRLTGAVVNPNLELLFQGPSLRPFNFTFKMSPRSKPESDNVKQIVRFFKENMAVQRSTANLFLKAPNVFDIQYLYKSGVHPALNRIKTCALINCSIDYTPEGSYMTYEDDGTMVSYTMVLQFSELEPVYADDYKNIPKTDIGY